ncbi:glycine cleavage T protein [Legionella beliardensis]|uniref:Glycine cleavage T protein n=1 Tax=Legionella beliardensis TaxID=91822 RepID=A0A378I396_9GAMM|nr:folate-binding protein YgfZ [Legionella beliardensis]STX29156.1 glycine cleavage T protein [Legionella beliardensis]
MKQPFYLINNRQYTLLADYNTELFLEDNQNYLFDLSYLSIIHVIGDNAATFLQGQLTCDIRDVTTSTMRQGALCNLKGRIQALLDIVNPRGYQLILAADLVADTVASLSKVAMLSRVKLQAITDYKVYGFYLTNDCGLLPAGIKLPQIKYALSVNGESYCYSLGEKLFIIVIPSAQHAELTEPFINMKKLRGSLAWHRLQIASKQIQIYPDTRGLFLPHRLDLHRNGYISFDKGCYKGQEIIARTHYRAKLKHSLEVFKISTNESISAGKKLMNSSRQSEVGEIVDYCPLPNKDEFLIAASVLHDYPPTVFIEGQQDAITLERVI